MLGLSLINRLKERLRVQSFHYALALALALIFQVN